jgi:hypothetical protein
MPSGLEKSKLVDDSGIKFPSVLDVLAGFFGQTSNIYYIK